MTISYFIQKSYKAKSEGVDLIEFDISLTKDGVAVILHDDTLDRTTNMSGPIRSFFHRDLIHCNPAANFMHSHSERFTYLLFTNKIYIGDDMEVSFHHLSLISTRRVYNLAPSKKWLCQLWMKWFIFIINK